MIASFMRKYFFLLLLVFISCRTVTEKNNKTSANSNAGKAPGINKNISDSALFNLVEQQTFNYFWEGAEPTSGLARERFHADNIYPEND